LKRLSKERREDILTDIEIYEKIEVIFDKAECKDIQKKLRESILDRIDSESRKTTKIRRLLERTSQFFSAVLGVLILIVALFYVVAPVFIIIIAIGLMIVLIYAIAST